MKKHRKTSKFLIDAILQAQEVNRLLWKSIADSDTNEVEAVITLSKAANIAESLKQNCCQARSAIKRYKN